MSSSKSSTQVAIIGGGPGGYTAAFMAADLGMKTTLIDLDPNPGGACLYRGCIPSKALLHAAKVLSEAQEAEHWGIHFTKPKIDLGKLRESTNAVIGQMTGGLGQLCKARKVDLIQGRASFTSSTTLHIEGVDGTTQELSFEHAILATGSKPATFPALELDSPRVMDSTDALKLKSVPKTLLVVGGGYIGLELGTVYAALGSKVTVVEVLPTLLAGADPDLAKPVAVRMKALCKEILLETRVVKMEKAKGAVKVTFDGPKGTKAEQKFEKVLVSVGRSPVTEGLGLEHTKVAVSPQGFVGVDNQMRTDDPTIFAIGDVVGQPMLAHKASHEGRVAAEVIAGHNVAFEPRAIPAVVFTDPEVAWCGLTEAEAKKQGTQVKVARFPWAASGRATTLNRNEGLTKIIVDPKTDEILGVGIVGSGAGELIAEGVLAMEMGATAKDIELTIHPHPTLSETIMETAEMIHGTSTHIFRPKKG